MSFNNNDTAQQSREYFPPPQFGENVKFSQETMRNYSHRQTDINPPTTIVPCTHPSINTPQRTCEDNPSGKPPLELQLNRANLSTTTETTQTTNQRDCFWMLTFVPITTTISTWFMQLLATLVHAVISSKHERHPSNPSTEEHQIRIAKTFFHASMHHDLDLSPIYDYFEAQSSLTNYGMQSSEWLSRSFTPLSRGSFDAQEQSTICMLANNYAVQSSSPVSRSFQSSMQPTRDPSNPKHGRHASVCRIRLTTLSELSFLALIIIM